MKNNIVLLLAVLTLWACKGPAEENSWLPHTDGFRGQYKLQQVVILSRHNMRTPLVGSGSVLERLTNPEYQWYPWEDPASNLTAKGVRLETLMGSFFNRWLSDQELLAIYQDKPSSFRFYANAKQRCQLTARTFADAVLPGAHPEVEMKVPFDTMDPVFNPQITKLPEGFEEKAQEEISALFGDVDASLAQQYRLLEKIVDIRHSPACADTSSFSQFPSSVSFQLYKEPAMLGGLKMACAVSDALVLQYYEEPDSMKASFGYPMKEEDWERVSHVKDVYGEVLFTAPSVAVNVAHPLLQTMLEELSSRERVFTFLCGHDSNIASVLTALEVQPHTLPQSVEKGTPIGSKILIEKFASADGSEYADLWLVYASTRQLRRESALSYSFPPCAVRLRLKGLEENRDSLYRLSDLQQRFSKAIAAYDNL